MKLWLLKRTDEVDYDETDAMVVRADDEASAHALAIDGMPDWDRFKRAPLDITEVTPEGEPGVIIVDFLRG